MGKKEEETKTETEKEKEKDNQRQNSDRDQEKDDEDVDQNLDEDEEFGEYEEYEELEMPTEFDNFTQQAHSNVNENISNSALQNRQLLKEVLEKHGFSQLPHEGWHFNYNE